MQKHAVTEQGSKEINDHPSHNFVSLRLRQLFVVRIEVAVRNVLDQHRGFVSVVINEKSADGRLGCGESRNRLRRGVKLNPPTRELALKKWPCGIPVSPQNGNGSSCW